MSAVMFTGEAGLNTYRALTVKQGIKLYAKCGMLLTRGATIGKLMKLATQITGKKFKARDYDGAVNELEIWLAANGAAHD